MASREEAFFRKGEMPVKYLRKKKRSPVLPVICVICLLAVIGAVAFLLTDGDPLEMLSPTIRTQPTATVENMPTAETVADTLPPDDGDGRITIDTPYGEIFYPAAFEDTLRIDVREDNGYRLAFFARLEGREDQPIFDLIFGDDAIDPVGVVTAADGTGTPVAVAMVDFAPDAGWLEDEKNLVLAMQEAINDLVKALDPLMNPSGEVEIETPYVTLRYPGVWRDQLVVEQTDNTVTFFGKLPEREKTPLFSLTFGGDETGAIGHVRDDAGREVSVRLTVEELFFDDGWTTEEMDTLYSMQESMNELMDALMTEMEALYG